MKKTGKIEPAKIKGLLDMGVKSIYEIETEDDKKIRTTGNHPYLVKQNSSLLFSSLFNGSAFQDRINNDCPGQDQNCADEIKNSHDYLIKNTLIVQQYKAMNVPDNINQIFSGAVGVIKKGITNEAKKICPRLANIPETTFICPEENLSPINYNDNTSKSNVNSQWIKVAYLLVCDAVANEVKS